MTSGSGLAAVRIALPALLGVAGVVLLVAGEAVLGAALLIVAVLVIAANLWMRLGLSSQADRDREASAREEFLRTGRWPR